MTPTAAQEGASAAPPAAGGTALASDAPLTPACGVAASSSPGDAAAAAAAAKGSEEGSGDFVSPFASSFVQAQCTGTPTPVPASPPPDASEGASLLRVVGFESSPTSVMALRRWQSAADPSTAGCLSLEPQEGPGADADGRGQYGQQGKLGTLQRGSGCEMTRQSSLGAALKQHEQLAQLQKRLSIHTGRGAGASSHAAAGQGMRRLQLRPQQHVSASAAHAPLAQRMPAAMQAALPPAAHRGPPVAAAIAEDLEQDWLAALTPGSSQLQDAAQAEAAAAAAVAAAAAAAAAAAGANPFAAQAQIAFAPPGEDIGPQPISGTLPSNGLAGARHLPAAGQPSAGARVLPRITSGLSSGGTSLPPPMPPPMRANSGMLRAGSTSIDIPYHKMRRAETAPAPTLSDELIAAAIAAASASSNTSSRAAAAAVAAAAAAPATAPPSGRRSPRRSPPSSGSSSYRSSPPGAGPPLPPVPERQASTTRELFEAQAEAVAAQAQARVLQQALQQEKERVSHLQQQLRSLLRERAEDKARLHEQEAATLQAHALLRAAAAASQHVQLAQQQAERAPSMPAPAPAAALQRARRTASAALPARSASDLERQNPTTLNELAAALAALGH